MKNFSTPLIVATLAFVSCSTNTGDPNKDRNGRVTNALLANAESTLGSALLSSFGSVINQEMTTGNVDWMAAGAQGLNTVSANVITSAGVERVVNAWTGGKAPDTAAAARSTFAKATLNGVPSDKAMQAIANVLSVKTTPLIQAVVRQKKEAVNREIVRGFIRLLASDYRVVPLEEQIFGPR